MSHRNRGESARAAAAADNNDMPEEAAAAASSSAPPPFDLKAMLAGCEYPQSKPIIQRLIVDFAKSAKDMYASHLPLTDVAKSWLKRAGPAAAESAEGKKKMADFERRLAMSVKKQHEILILNQVLNKLQTSVVTGHMAPDTDWGEWLVQEKQALASDASEREKIISSTKNALEKFRDDCWSIHHRGEGRQVDSEIAVHAPAGQAQLVCPLSQSYYVHPMRNPECDHIFSRDSIVEVLQHAQNQALKQKVVELDPNFTTKCPLCNKKINLGMMFEDKELERRVSQHIRKEKDRQERGEMSENVAAAAAGNTNKRKRGVKQEPTGYDDLTQNVEAAADDDQEEGAAAAASPSRSRSARR